MTSFKAQLCAILPLQTLSYSTLLGFESYKPLTYHLQDCSNYLFISKLNNFGVLPFLISLKARGFPFSAYELQKKAYLLPPML